MITTTWHRGVQLRANPTLWRPPANWQSGCLAGTTAHRPTDAQSTPDRFYRRSYVLADEDGTLGSVCVYQAVDEQAIRRHSHRVGVPADEIREVLETVPLRPDPVLASASA